MDDQSIAEWTENFEQFSRNPPEPGDMLYTQDGSPIKLQIILEASRPPFIFTRAFVPQVVLSKLGWFAQSVNEEQKSGWKCIMMPKARSDIVNRFGLPSSMTVFVKSIRVVKKSESGKSLLCEVNEW